MSAFHTALVSHMSRALRKQKQFSKIENPHLLVVFSKTLHRAFETPEMFI